MIAADKGEIRRFVQAMFPHADEDVFASVRCFPQKGHGAPEIRAVRIDGTGLEPLVSTAFAVANRAARNEKATVVCLLVAGLANAERAREQDVANCLALSVDLDSNPGRGLEFLRGLLGPPTLVVESGGVWTSPGTGAVESKLHVYWRLSEPTRTPEEHARLKRARALATVLVGGDASNVPLVHPLRLPGSVHRKGEPRLARIIEENTDCEIHLEDALEALETAAQAQGVAIDRDGEGGNGAGDPREDQAIIADILSGTAYHTSLVALSARYAGRGMPRSQIVETLQRLMRMVPLEKLDGGQPGRWQSRYDDIERTVASAVEKFAPDPAQPDVNWKQRLANVVAELNERYFVATIGGSVRVASLVRDDVLGRARLVFMREGDIRLKYSHRHYKVGETQRGLDIIKGLGEAWLNHHQRRSYDRIALIPSGPCPADVYNLWRGWGVEPKAGSWFTIEAHLREVVCSGREAEYNWLVGWLAYCVQQPGRQAEVAVVLRGLKGTGKGMVGQMLMRLFQDHALHLTHSKHLVGNFNAHMIDALFLFVDEAFWAGDKQGEGTLKALITERTLMIEPKGVDSFPMPNRLKILMASNNDWVVPASADERRYFVLDVPDTRKGDKAYFIALAAAIEGDELPALLDYLLKLDLSDFDHRNPPHTEGLNKQKLIGADSLQKFWMDCLTTGTIVNADINDYWPLSVRCEDLHSAYIEHAHAHGDRHPLTGEQMGVRLRKLCPDGVLKVIRPRTEDGEKRPRHFALRSLEEHRRAFLEAMNIAHHDWPQVEASS